MSAEMKEIVRMHEAEKELETVFGSVVVSAEDLGETLRRLREARGLSAEALGRTLAISPTYVRALESHAYHVFPAKIYALGFLRKILRELSPKDADRYLALFHHEWGAGAEERRDPHPTPRAERLRAFSLTPARIGIGLSILFLSIIIGLVGTRLAFFVGSPGLLLEEPAEGEVRASPIIPVRGKTERESRLTVNGREITIDPNGSFSAEVELAPGVHLLEFVVRNRFDKETRVKRLIVVE